MKITGGSLKVKETLTNAGRNGIPAEEIWEEKADQILTYQSSGYGVRNVCDRIHVLYGEKGEMKIESTPGKGTRVFIRIPKNTEAKVL